MDRHKSPSKIIFLVIILLSLALFAACAEDSEVEALPASVYNSLYGNTANADFEGGSDDGWTMGGLWHTSSVRSSSGSYSAWYGQEGTGDYDTGVANAGSMERSVDLTNVTTLDFDFHLDNENGYGVYNTYDLMTVNLSTNSGASWPIILADWTSTPALVDNFDGSGKFTAVSVDLSTYTGQTVMIRFYFDTIDFTANNYQGLFVDNIVFQ